MLLSLLFGPSCLFMCRQRCSCEGEGDCLSHTSPLSLFKGKSLVPWHTATVSSTLNFSYSLMYETLGVGCWAWRIPSGVLPLSLAFCPLHCVVCLALFLLNLTLGFLIFPPSPCFLPSKMLEILDVRGNEFEPFMICLTKAFSK